MKTTSIMLVGVGGQGTLLASKVLGNMLLESGQDVKVSEIHGMAQRGGSVVTYIRFGEKVHSPISGEGNADYIIGFESLEAYRWLPYLKKDGTMIANSQKISPMPVIAGAAKYPENISKELSEKVHTYHEVNAIDMALECGNSRAVNVVLLGVLAQTMNFDKEIWVNAIKNTVPEKVLDVNLKAFEMGYNCAAS